MTDTMTVSIDSDFETSEEDFVVVLPKRRKIEGLQFKGKVEMIIDNLTDTAPGEFSVYGKLDGAPIVTIAIKNADDVVVHFPLYENEASKIIKSFEQSPYGKGSQTVVDATVRNSWELNANGFEILNPNWNTFINDEVVARIKKEMFLECSFSASLYKLLMYKTGSFFKPHRDSEKVDMMFGTLVIQLPSLYKGGQLIVRHDGKTIRSDFSSTDSSNAFGTFFTAFYCDCEHEILPVTEGYRVCLVYNLISHRSAIPVAPQKHNFEVELKTLIENWKFRGKLVYALKHKYSESNLSFDNLKTTDRVVANFLVSIGKTADLHVFLAIFSKESSGQDQNDCYYDSYGGYDDANFDSSDEDFSDGKFYSLKNLISMDGDNSMPSLHLSVDFDEEVIPENCFENIEPYRKTAMPTGNAGIEVNKYYRSAAIVFWPKQYCLQVLKSGGVSSTDLDKIFLKEIGEYSGKVKDDKVKAKLMIWAQQVLSAGGNKSIDVIRAIVEMQNFELMQTLFSHCVILNEVSTSLLNDVCERYGWETFAAQIAEMFKKLSKKVAVQLLDQLIGTGEMEAAKKQVVHNVLQIVLNTCKDETPSFSMWYTPPPTFEEKMNERAEQQDILLSICHLAERVSFNMLYFAKTKSLLVFVPVLFRLVLKEIKTLHPFWIEIATHFLHEMEKEIAKPVIVPNWRRNDRTNCSCTECVSLNAFLQSDQQTISLKIGKQRRRHLHEFMNQMQDIAHETDRGGHIGVLVIKKTTKTGFDGFEKRKFSEEFLPKLRVIMPLP